MKQVASLRYGVISKKAFCDLEIFKTFVHDVLGITLEIDKVETEKTFDKPIGKVIPRFDLYAEDLKNRVIVDIQHERLSDHYHRFLYYHCVALLEQISKAVDYRPTLKVFTIVVLILQRDFENEMNLVYLQGKEKKNEPDYRNRPSLKVNGS